MNLGICTAGCEEAFENHLLSAVAARAGRFRYLEIGIADGETLEAAHQIIAPRGGLAYGIDLPSSEHAQKYKANRSGLDKPTVMLLDGGIQKEIPVGFPLAFGFVFIDGCHGKACAMADFLAIEHFVYKGGIVCFHDACREDQGSSFQPHCDENINVRAALIKLGLLTHEPEDFNQLSVPAVIKDLQPRYGWKFLDEVHGDKSQNGNGMCFFERV